MVLAINCTTIGHTPSSVTTGLQGDHFSTPKGRMRSGLVSSPVAAPSPEASTYQDYQEVPGRSHSPGVIVAVVGTQSQRASSRI